MPVHHRGGQASRSRISSVVADDQERVTSYPICQLQSHYRQGARSRTTGSKLASPKKVGFRGILALRRSSGVGFRHCIYAGPHLKPLVTESQGFR